MPELVDLAKLQIRKSPRDGADDGKDPEGWFSNEKGKAGDRRVIVTWQRNLQDHADGEMAHRMRRGCLDVGGLIWMVWYGVDGGDVGSVGVWMCGCLDCGWWKMDGGWMMDDTR